jgi:hypothetical protein
MNAPKVTLQKVVYTEMRVNIMTSWGSSISALIGSCFLRYALTGRMTSRGADCAAMYSTFCAVSLERTSLPIGTLMEMISDCVNNTYFQYDKYFYKQ